MFEEKEKLIHFTLLQEERLTDAKEDMGMK